MVVKLIVVNGYFPDSVPTQEIKDVVTACVAAVFDIRPEQIEWRTVPEEGFGDVIYLSRENGHPMPEASVALFHTLYPPNRLQ